MPLFLLREKQFITGSKVTEVYFKKYFTDLQDFKHSKKTYSLKGQKFLSL